MTLTKRIWIISTIITFALLLVLPRIPVKIDNRILKLDSYIGGYYFKVGNFTVDLRDFKKGLDLKGGIRIVLRADMKRIPSVDQVKALESAKEVISRRVNMLGVTEPYVATVKTKDDARIIVEIPGVDNPHDAVGLIGQTAQLVFKQLKSDVEWNQDNYIEYLINPQVWEETGITGSDLRGAEVVLGQDSDIKNSGKPKIQLQFTNEGRLKFSEIAKRNVGKPVALYLDEGGFPLSAPIIDPELANGIVNDPVITGDFDMASAKNLAIQVRAGALPVPVEVLEQETIGATLGDESVRKSFFAGFAGLALVVLFLVFKYKKFGFIAGVSLVVYSLIVLAIFKLVPVVLTLPGIAGFVLSIGMATDANILIFERIKEELFWGKSESSAIENGFSRAWNSIRDSNVSSLITSFILFQLGSGPIKGFALTLALGILVSLFTSIFVVKTFIDVSYEVSKPWKKK